MHLERSEDEEEAGEHQAGEGHEVEAGQGLGQPLVVAAPAQPQRVARSPRAVASELPRRRTLMDRRLPRHPVQAA